MFLAPAPSTAPATASEADPATATDQATATAAAQETNTAQDEAKRKVLDTELGPEQPAATGAETD